MGQGVRFISTQSLPTPENGGTESVLGGKHLEPGDPRAQAYQRTAVADGEGRFVFADLPAGEYYVVSSVSLESHAGSSTNSTPDSVVGQEVRLQAGMRVDLELDDVHTTVATSWNPVMPPSAIPVGVATQVPQAEAAGTDSPLTGSPQYQTVPTQVTPTAAVRASEDPVPGAHGSAPTSPSPGGSADSLPSEPTTRALTHDPQVRLTTGDLRRFGNCSVRAGASHWAPPRRDRWWTERSEIGRIPIGCTLQCLPSRRIRGTGSSSRAVLRWDQVWRVYQGRPTSSGPSLPLRASQSCRPAMRMGRCPETQLSQALHSFRSQERFVAPPSS